MSQNVERQNVRWPDHAHPFHSASSRAPFHSTHGRPEEELVVEDETPKPQIVAQETNDIISDVISNLDAMESKTEVKEEVDQITSIRAEFEKFKTHIQQHISNQGLSGGGSGETRVEFLDDVDRDTAKVNGKALVYNSSAGKWKGESVLTGAITGLDIDGGTDIGADLADAEVFINCLICL